jgi:hypothetical protein
MGNTPHTHRYADMPVMNKLTIKWLRINMISMNMIVMPKMKMMVML